MPIVVAISCLAAGLVTGAVLGGLIVSRRRAGAVEPAALVTDALDALDRRSTQATHAAVQAAVAQVLEVNRAQLEQQSAAHRAELAAQQMVGAERIDAQSKATEATFQAQSQAGRDDLAAKEQLIESRLAQVQLDLRTELTKVTEMLSSLKETSQESFGMVSSQLAFHARSTNDLASTTHQLREALASTKARGQWGERMAEDVLHLAGFVENVNYVKQTALTVGTGIPDYTFTLPKGHKLYMDVKFPLAAYLRYLEADSDLERSMARKQFLSDVRLRVKELARRDYAAGADSLNDVLLFIPNETISGFIHEHEPSLFEDALRQHIVFCSPLTLFAMLGVIRQAYDNFMVEAQATEILGLVSQFKGEWTKYQNQLDKISRGFDSLQRGFLDLNGARRNKLDRAVNHIDAIRSDRGLPAAVVDVSDDNVYELGAG